MRRMERVLQRGNEYNEKEIICDHCVEEVVELNRGWFENFLLIYCAMVRAGDGKTSSSMGKMHSGASICME